MSTRQQSGERPLRIAHIITPSRLSGAERYMMTLAERLNAEGHSCVILCKHRAQSVIEECARRGLDVQPVRLYGKADVTAPFRLARRLRAVHADVVHTHLSTASLWGSVAAHLAGLPAVATVQGRNTATCYRYADRLIANSQAVREHMLAQGIPPERITVVYNAVDVSAFRRVLSPAEAKQRLGLDAHRLIIGTAAHLSLKKGHDVLLRAAAEVVKAAPDCHFVLLGEGDQRSALERLGGRLGLRDRVTFLGFRHDAADVMSAYDIFALASWWEPFGLVFVEAMALGVPVVTTRAGGAPEVVAEGETGLLVPPGDPPALARALLRLATDGELRRRLGQAGPTRAARFDVAHLASEVEAVYHAALGGRRPTACSP